MLGFVGCAAGIQAYRLSVQRRFLRLEQEAALQRERERIAQDMHDDLGANLTKIAMLSEVARQQAENAEQARSMAGEISEMARGAVDNISEIVWVTNPRNDDLENLVAYLRSHAAEYFENTSISCVINFPEDLPAAEVKGELRRDILLVFKEALHNAARHSGASQVDVALKVTRNEASAWYLSIAVSDNGCGFDVPASQSLGNGLESMVYRLQRRGGLVTILSKPQQGTRVTMSVPLAAGVPNPSTTFM